MKKSSFIIVLIYLASQVNLIGQNPFDIKNPVQNSTKSEPVAVPEKKTPLQESAKQEPITEKTSTPLPSKNPSGTTPVNVFDIKAGPGPKVLTPPVSNASNDKKTQLTPVQTKNQDTMTHSVRSGLSKTDAPRSTAHGLKEVTNPFNIVPPKQGSKPIVAPPVALPDKTPPIDLTEIKSGLKQLKEAPVKDQDSISKNAWFVIYIFLGLLAAIAINFNRSYPMALIRATYNQNQLRILFKDAFKGNHILIFGILYVLFIINGGIFLFQSFRIFELGHISFLVAIGLVLAVYLIRHLVLFVLGLSFPLTRETLLFSYTIGIYNLALGLALMLINIILSFVEEETGKMLIFSGLSIILAMYILRQVRGLLNNMPLIISGKFHFIIYLCTVEIAPWLLLTGILLR